MGRGYTTISFTFPNECSYRGKIFNHAHRVAPRGGQPHGRPQRVVHSSSAGEVPFQWDSRVVEKFLSVKHSELMDKQNTPTVQPADKNPHTCPSARRRVSKYLCQSLRQALLR